MLILCFSCLSTDRKLIPVKNFKYHKILTDVGILLNFDVDVICWECAAIVTRLHRFTQQVLKAQQVLVLQSKLNRFTKIQTISPLRRTAITKFDKVIVYYDGTKNSCELADYGLIDTKEEDMRITEVTTRPYVNDVVFCDTDDHKDNGINKTVPLFSVKNNMTDNRAPVGGVVTEKSTPEVLRRHPLLFHQLNSRQYIPTTPSLSEIKDITPKPTNVEMPVIKVEDGFIIVNDDVRKSSDPVENKAELHDELILKTEEVYLNDLNEVTDHSVVDDKITVHKAIVTDQVPKSVSEAKIDESYKHIYVDDIIKAAINKAVIVRPEKTKCNEKGEDIVIEILTTSQDGGNIPSGDSKLTYIMKHSNIRKFTVEELLEDREKRKNSIEFKNKPFKCEFCVEMFPMQKAYDKHMVNHKSNGTFVCRICTQKFVTQILLNEHYDNHFSRFDCRQCNYTCFDENAINHHYERFHEINPSTCLVCNTVFQTKYNYYYHRRKEHKKKLECKDCGILLQTADSLKRHIVQLHSDMPTFECGICRKKYRGERRLRDHERRIHSGKKRRKKVPGENEGAYCVDCNTHYRTDALYRAHLKYTVKHNAQGDHKYKCPYCDKRFVVQPSLRYHVETYHDNNTRYTCDDCGQDFKTKLLMRRHVLKHTKVVKKKDKICDICGKMFADKPTLEQHINSHLGRRPYSCNLCGATFSFSGARYTHIKLKHKKRPENK